MRMKASDYIAEFLRVQQIPHVFEVAGGMITHLLDSIYRLGNTNIISVHHEQAAAFAADACGRSTGKPGIALATSGPGATNLLTGIGSCYFDSSPAIFITGQVNIHEQKGDRKIRQLGFQETDIVSMAEPITKKCYRVESADQIESILIEAYQCAINGRPGPVLIDIPMNLQRAEIEVAPIEVIEREMLDTNFESIEDQIPGIQPLSMTIESLAATIKASKKPLILAGGGINSGQAKKEFLKFVELVQVPVITSLMGLDVIPFDHPLRIGMIGTYGNRWANIAFGSADLIIIMGSRLDIRQTGANLDIFEDKTIFHIDCEEGEINNRIKNCIPVLADIKHFLNKALTQLKTETFTLCHKWHQEIDSLKTLWPDTNELKDCKGINPNVFMHSLSKASKNAVAYLADVGNHQMWAAQSLEIAAHQSFLTSGGMGAMGFALPAAIGASLSSNKKPVVTIIGDGSFQFNIQELQTIVRNKLPIKIVIINNQALGMIRQFQDSYFEGRYQSTYWGYSVPDFSAIATAYGIPAKTISHMDEINGAVDWMWEDHNSAALLHVMIDTHTNVYPKIAFGKDVTEMEPFSQPSEVEST